MIAFCDFGQHIRYGCEYDDSSDVGPQRPLLPQPIYLYSGRLEDGQTAMAADTCGDGACSLHCLWGSLISTPAGNTFYCDDARAKLVEAMPDDVDVIFGSSCGANRSPKIVPKRHIIEAKSQEQKALSQRPCWTRLGGSWRGLGASWRPSPKNARGARFFGTLLGSSWRPLGAVLASKMVPESKKNRS